MTDFTVSRSLNNFAGGLLGLAMLGEMGFDGFVINNEYSVLVSKDHASIKSFSGDNVPEYIIEKLAEYLKYKEYHVETKKDDECVYIYNDGVKE